MRIDVTSQRSGAVLPLVAISMIGIMGFIALAIDVGMMAVARTQAQSAVDVGALAGARTLDGQSGNNKDNAVAEAIQSTTANYMLSSPIASGQVTTVSAGVYRYNATAQRFQADFVTPPSSSESYGAMQVRITTAQPTYFGRVLGINSVTVSAMATAVHRPRDISVVLDFSGSMRFSSEFSYPGGTSGVTGSLNPDGRFPRYGPWSIYPELTSGSHAMQRLTAYVDSGGETHAANNLTIDTANGPPVVNNFQTATGSYTNAFVYNGDLNGGGFNINNTPVCTPTPSTWSSQYASGYVGDRWPLKQANWSNTSPTTTHFARTAAEMLGISSVTTSTRSSTWETDGYDRSDLTFKNGQFKGYSMGPGYYGKTFYIWPPDPRYNSAADPTSISTTNPIQDSSGRVMADWRKRFFLERSGSSSTKGSPLDDNSLLFTSSGTWQTQNLGNTVRYIPNYDAILKWLKNGPQVLPPSLRAGRVLYYSSIPDSIPMNWTTGLINTSATIDQRFWKEYIDFVIGCGRHSRTMTLYGYGTSTFNTGKITAASSLTGTIKPYMAYDDSPVHPRLHMWFGPLTMLGFLAVDSNNLSHNWFAGTTYEAQTWQLKAGIQSALEDIRKNHPNDLAALAYFSSHNGYNSARVSMGKSFDKMKNCLFYPNSLLNSLSTATSEIRPYKTSSSASSSNPCALDVFNYQANVPNADGGTNPAMGLMVAYNEFNWGGGFGGRRGANKMVILETDGVANQNITGTFSSISGGGGTRYWTSIANNTSGQGNGQPAAMNPAITLAWLISQDSAGSKPWPSFPSYTNGSGLPTASAPSKWSGLTSNGPGFSTTRQTANVHALAFGELFEDSTSSLMKTRALELLRNIQIAGGLSADPTTGTIENYKIITGDYNTRIDKIRQAFERIMQGGVQVALIQ